MRWPEIQKSVSVIALAVTFCIGGTVAFFSDYDKAENRVAVGRNDTEIYEEFPDPSDPGDNETPEYKKTVWVGNTSQSEKGFNVDCYVRMSLSYSNWDIGKAVTLLGLDTANWVYNSEDGYYYYRSILKEGEVTAPLFTGFRINRKNVDDIYQDMIDEFQINVYEESIEAADFADYQSAWTYYLNPIGRT